MHVFERPPKQHLKMLRISIPTNMVSEVVVEEGMS